MIVVITIACVQHACHAKTLQLHAQYVRSFLQTYYAPTMHELRKLYENSMVILLMKIWSLCYFL